MKIFTSRKRYLVRGFRSMPTISDKKKRKREEYIALLARNLYNCSDRTRREVLGALSAKDKAAVLAAIQLLKES
jgi:hypothetical protein